MHTPSLIASLCACLLALATLLASTPAAAESLPTARLTYERVGRASACPTEQALRDGVAARLGYDPFGADSPRLVRVRITPMEDVSGYVASIALETPHTTTPQTRELRSEGARCDELIQALIFTVSVAIDPSATVRASGSPDKGLSTVMAAVLRVHDAQSAASEEATQVAGAIAAVERPVAPPPTPPPADEPSRPPLSMRAAAGGGAAAGLSPGVAAVIHLNVALERPMWSVGLGAAATLPTQTDLDAGRLETSLIVAEVLPCWRRRWLRACGVGVLGSLRTTGIELERASSNSSVYAALGARVSADLEVAPATALRLYVQAQGVLARTRALVDGEQVWRTPDFAGHAGASIVFTLF